MAAMSPSISLPGAMRPPTGMLLGAMSWMILGFGHMIAHPHLDVVVFYLPFLPLVYAVVALRVATVARRVRPGQVAERPDASKVDEDIPRRPALVGAGDGPR
jgi:hypothetical protein